MAAMTVRHDQVDDHVDGLDLDVRIGSFFLRQNRGCAQNTRNTAATMIRTRSRFPSM